MDTSSRMPTAVSKRRKAGKTALALLGLAFATALASPALADSCSDCHHPGGAPVPHEDPTCRDIGCSENCHAKDLSLLRHPLTPLPVTRTEICNTCHNRPFTAVYHPYEIEVSGMLPTTPGMVDLDQACGQCHGGGSQFAATTGTISAGSVSLATSGTTGFLSGEHVRIAGAGALEADGVTHADLDTSIVTVAGTTITVADAAIASVINATVEQNPTLGMAPYFDRPILSLLADEIHGDAPFATFTYTYVPPGSNRLHVRLNAAASACPGGTCTTFDWDFGDGNTGTGITVDHLYATGGLKTVSLTVTGTTDSSTTVSKTVKVFAPYTDAPPVIGGNDVEDCGSILSSPNTWGASIVDQSADDQPLKQVSVTWGDGSLMDIKSALSTFVHTYTKLPVKTCRNDVTERQIVTATTQAQCDQAEISLGQSTSFDRYFYVTHLAVDSIGQQSAQYCTVQLPTFTASGNVYRADGTTAVNDAAVTLKRGSTIVTAVKTSASGAFAFTGLKPGDYTLDVTKTGLAFALPAASLTVGGNATGITISAK